MQKKIKILITIIVMIDAGIVFFLFRERSFSHLAVWKVVESSKKSDFYWPPESAPAFFTFTKNSVKLADFKKDADLLMQNGQDAFSKALILARHVRHISARQPDGQGSLLKIASADSMLKQIKSGAVGAHCFHLTILFSAYLFSEGLESRVWALEGDRFSAKSQHTVNEVYLKPFDKWVFMDVTQGFYVSDKGVPLSLLELREKLLSGDTRYEVYDLNGSQRGDFKLSSRYSSLLNTVFLRAGNDFLNNYTFRPQWLFDAFPNKLRLGMIYWVSGKEIFMHYVDYASGSLKREIFMAKNVLWFLIVTAVGLCLFGLYGFRDFFIKKLLQK